ncbi:MAG TPA: hypothetical protein VG125_12125 [Pirellulales bacterium]|jgi:hypothetical protein|nr:hypothetical protein [Pirellulales bacterium]
MMCIVPTTSPRPGARRADRPRNHPSYEKLLAALYAASDAAQDATAADGPGSEVLQPEDLTGMSWALAHCLAVVESNLVPSPAMR